MTMRTGTAEQLRWLDQTTINGDQNIGLRLMERASRGMNDEALSWLDRPEASTAAVFCGPGNNGGDGVACARMLKEAGVTVRVFLVGGRNKMTPDTRVNEERLNSCSVQIEDFDPGSEQQKHFTEGADLLIDAIFGQYCEEELVQPTFVTDYPIEMSPLCKRHRSNPELTERFELFVNGKELCNAYSELNDPIDQLERFQEQLQLSEKGDDEAMFIDMDFVRALEYGMPSCSGMGIGIDRLTMFMTDQASIQDVLFFPQMRPEKKAVSDPVEKYTEIGVPEEWVPVIQKMGYITVEALKKLAPGKFFNDLCGFNKKNKLGLKAPSIEEVKKWCEE